MLEKHFEFIVPDEMGVGKLKAKLNEFRDFKEEPPITIRRIFYDSFDWRVYTSGSVLEEKQSENKNELSCYSLNRENFHGEMDRGEKVLRFARDFPEGSLRNYLTPILEMRALLPQVKIETKEYLFQLLNKDRKIILRVSYEESTLTDGQTLTSIVRVFPIKGYDKPLKKVLKLLKGDLDLLPPEENFMLTALRVAEREAGDYSSSLNIQLDSAIPANAATKLVLLYLLKTMSLNEKGVIEDIDSEFLHDFRVAVRRTRSALGQIKEVFPIKQLERFRAQFDWLGQITGPTRDMDVYLLQFDDYKAKLPAAIREEIEPLRNFLIQHQNKEQQSLANELKSARYIKFMKDWRKFLESPSLESTASNAARPVKDVASERIWRIYQRAVKEGSAINSTSVPESLHDLRKTCKKLRYLIEFFQSLYSKEEIDKIVKALKELQENLGYFQDYQVQRESMEHFGQQMMEESKIPAATLMAMGILIEGLEEAQLDARGKFKDRFTEFASHRNHKLFEKLFVTAHSKKESK
jgi:CHAD domain-containing protein